MKTILEYIGAWLTVGAFYVLVYVSHASEIAKKIYYDMFGIPYRTYQDKFHPVYKRTDTK